MSQLEQRQKNKETFRREILDAARELFSREGYGNFSMRRLAKRIEHSPTTIYLYFRDKDEILFCLCEELFAELYREMADLWNGGGQPLEILRNALRMYVEFGVANPEHYKVAFFTSQSVYGSPHEYLENDTMSRRAYFYYRDLVAECSTSAQLRPMDADLLAQVLWTGVHGIVAAIIFTRDFPLADTGELVETMVDALLKGLGR
jgi:AcrR family transcriptional regulator